MIEMTDVRRTFGRSAHSRPELRVPRVVIPDGARVHVIGPNGSGRSTLVKLMLGILRSTHGEILVEGLSPWSARRRLMRDTGVLWGHRSTLWWDASGADALDALRSIYSRDPQRYAATVDRLTSALRADDFLDRPIRTLSLGQRQRVEFIAALANEPRRLFLDEPFIGLDGAGRTLCLAVLKELPLNTTVLMVDHNGEDLADYERIQISADSVVTPYQG